jgi:hypothetical protein
MSFLFYINFPAFYSLLCYLPVDRIKHAQMVSSRIEYLNLAM